MTAANASDTVDVAREYYNSSDADEFYASIWGGQDIHIGLYDSESDSIFDASRRTVKRVAAILGDLDPTTSVLDIGSGYGGAARFLAQSYGCRVVALNLSEVENTRARALNKEEGVDELINVVEGSFEEIPYPDGAFDVVWSQDAILHSGQREKVLAEVARVLKPGGRFVFTDPMQSDDCPDGVLEPILDRIHLESLGSPAFYRRTAEKVGMKEETFEQLTPHLIEHYARVLKETEKRAEQLATKISVDYIERMKAGLQRWVEGGEKGYLAWGIFHFRKS